MRQVRSSARLVAALTLLACSADHGPDGGVANDAEPNEIDASVIGAPAVVTVIVRFGGTAGSDTLVAFHDAAGTTIDVVRADALGVAISNAPGIAAVTVAPGAGIALFTLEGIVAGDVVRFEPDLTMRDVVLPGMVVGDASYIVSTPCAHTTSIGFPMGGVAACDGAGATNVIAIAVIDRMTAFYASQFAAPSVDPVVLGPWRDVSDVEEVPVTLVGASSAAVFTWAGTAHGLVPLFVGSTTSSAHVPRDLTAGTDLVVSATVPVSMLGGQLDVYVPLADRSGVTIDLSSGPRVTSMTPDHSDPQRPSVGWVSTGGYGMAHLYLGTATELRWVIVAPAPVSELRAPSLPDELARLRPADFAAYGDLVLDATRTVAAYGAFKQHPLGPGGPLPTGASLLVHVAF